MCGIAGLVDFVHQSNSDTLKKMTEVLFHRGPDDGGYFFEAFDRSQVGLGHRRLSILDLSKYGHQPMSFGRLTMVYNGEIYNFKEIRTELEKIDYKFESNSDTEVILKAYHQWGIEAVHRFNGMFAIAIFDSQKQTLSLIRDRAGVKPLYWYQKDGLFMFASELKSFHAHPSFVKELNHDGLALFLQYGYIPQPHTIFNHTHKLQAGHSLEFNIKNSKLSIEKFWDVIDCYNQTKLDISEQEAMDEVERLLKSSCEYRMVSDVPVGIFLSGGYDSSAVTSLLQSERTERLKTFSIGFHDEKFNEAHHAKNVANYLGTDHTEYYCTQKDALDILPKLPEIWDEPFGDASVIPTTLISQLARKHVTVSLSADGGDEIFGGYDKYHSVLKMYNIFSKLPFKSKIECIMGSVNPERLPLLNKACKFNRRYKKIQQALIAKNPINILSLTSNVFTPVELKFFLKISPNFLKTHFDDFDCLQDNLGVLDKLLAIDYKTYQLDDILTKVDRATMSVGLEGREPFLDYRIIDFVAKLDQNLKINNGTKKYLLKKIVHKYLPKEIMDRPKMGFGVPIFDWFKTDLKVYLMTYLSEERIIQGGIFNVNAVINLRDRYLAGLDINFNQIWFLLMFEMWKEKWMS
jgi:asparagine synthase (glutamine-hydrolysing)